MYTKLPMYLNSQMLVFCVHFGILRMLRITSGWCLLQRITKGKKMLKSLEGSTFLLIFAE